MMSKNWKNSLSVFTLFAMLFSTLPLSLTYAVDAQINIDGNLDDWDNVSRVNASNSVIAGKVKAANDAEFLYLSYDGAWTSWMNFTIDIYIDGTQATAPYGSITINSTADSSDGSFDVLDAWSANIDGASGEFVSSNPLEYWGYEDLSFELAVPLSTFDYSQESVPEVDIVWTTLDNAEMTAEQIGTEEEPEPVPEENPVDLPGDENVEEDPPPQEEVSPGGIEEIQDPDNQNTEGELPETEDVAEPITDGIVIDGYFSDWADQDLLGLDYDPAHESQKRDELEYVSAVWNGDYIYIYVQAIAGLEHRYSFQWDMYFELNSNEGVPVPFEVTPINAGQHDGGLEVLGPSGASVAGGYNNDTGRWEIAIPVSSLGSYTTSVDLRWSDDNSIIIGQLTDISNSGGTPPVVSSELAIDGFYSDWDTVLHSELSWDSANTTTVHAGALVIQDEILYVHLIAADGWKQLPTNAMQLYVNGNISYNNKGEPLIENSMLIALAEVETDQTMGALLKNIKTPGTIDDLGAFEYGNWPQLYLGEATFTVYDSKHDQGDESEFSISLDQIAAYYGLAENEVYEITMYFPRLGAQQITTTGVSTGPYIGIALAIAVVGGYMFISKRKKETVE